ncbi:MAG: phage tail protein [Salinibacter sp.]
MRDVNDTGFKLVLGRPDWRDQFGVDATATDDAGAAVVYDAEGRCATLRSLVERFPRRPAEPALGPSDRTSAARDRYGSWYWIDPTDSTRIVVRSAGDETVTTFWPPETEEGETSSGEVQDGTFRPVDDGASSEPPSLGALTITTDHRLVVGAQSPDQLLVFDLHAGGPPQRIPWVGDAAFAPADATPRPDGGLYLLEKPKNEAPRLWALDHTLRPEGAGSSAASRSHFRPTNAEDRDGEPVVPPSPAIPPTLSSDLQPQVIEALPNDWLLVLSEDDTLRVLRLVGGAGRGGATATRYRTVDTDPPEKGPTNLADILKPEDQDDVDWSEWRAYDMAFVPGSPGVTEVVQGTLYVVGTDGNQAYALRLTGDAESVSVEVKPTYLPLRRFSGKGLVEADGTVYYDLTDRWVPLRPQRNPRFVDRGEIASAKPFDSEIVGCTWHRLFVDACIPPETTVHVESRASDQRDRLSDQPWQPEPDLYQRDTGAEIPYYDAFPNGDSDREGRGTWELLLQHAEGRYLELRLTLEGNGRSAPRLYALRAYVPRFSYLEEYLPDVYQENEASARFVERFLANAEGMLTNIEGKIAQAKALFDVRTVPDEYLDWLATWFGASFDPALDARRKRLFLDHAVELFNQRGTLAGLARMLTLVLDPRADEFLFTPAGVADAIGRPADATDRTARRQSVRLVEQFATRDVPRAAVGDARTPEQPTQVRVDQPWTPGDGADTLHRRFRAFLDRERYDTLSDRTGVWSERPSFPPLLPSADDKHADQRRADWRVFARRVIDGPYAAIDAGSVRRESGEKADAATQRYRTFLKRHYTTLDPLPAALREGASRFGDVQLPRELPSGDALRDWMQFVGVVLPIHRSAHRFRVLVPVDPDADGATQRRRLDTARRVVETQKPAHTAFEVLPYWAAFRVGTVRTGLDTVLGRGSRYSPLLVGEGALAEETVGAAHPENVPDRRVVGRDAADAPRPL